MKHEERRGNECRRVNKAEVDDYSTLPASHVPGQTVIQYVSQERLLHDSQEQAKPITAMLTQLGRTVIASPKNNGKTGSVNVRWLA